MTKLKPCPFCGGKADLRIAASLDYVLYKVLCTQCFINSDDPEEVEESSAWYEEKEQAIKLWNTRQSFINWQSIGELSIDKIRNERELLLWNMESPPIFVLGSYFAVSGENGVAEWIVINGNSVTLNEVVGAYTHFAVITSPKGEFTNDY